MVGSFIGASFAFAFGLITQWHTRNNAKRLAGNVAILTLAEMYSAVNTLNKSLFVEQLPVLRETLGREPQFFQIKPVVEVPVEITLDMVSLGFLAESHDPDIFARLVTVRDVATSMSSYAAHHATLHREFQSIVAKSDGPKETVGDVRKIAGADLWAQLQATHDALKDGLPRCLKDICVVAAQLVEVLEGHFPTRRFVRFVPEDRGPVSEAEVKARLPTLWRRVVRWIRL